MVLSFVEVLRLPAYFPCKVCIYLVRLPMLHLIPETLICRVPHTEAARVTGSARGTGWPPLSQVVKCKE